MTRLLIAHKHLWTCNPLWLVYINGIPDPRLHPQDAIQTALAMIGVFGISRKD